MSLQDIIMILLTVIGTILTAIAAYFVSEFKEMRHSVDTLNMKVGEVLGRIEHHEKRIEKLEEKA
jgi:glycopeptide antibiotics resistance protein